MNCWEILGVEKTANEREIKKAYAVKLKAIDMENELTQFQELKEAFDLAMSQIKASKANTPFEEEKIVLDVPSPQKKENFSLENSPLEPNLLDFQSDFQLFLSENNYFADVTQWQELLFKYISVNLDIMPQIQNTLFEFLNENYQGLSSKVREYLLYYVFTGDYINIEYELNMLVQRISQLPEFDFSFIEYIEPAKRKAYFNKRGRIFELFSQKNSLTEIKQALAICKIIYDDDQTLKVYDLYLQLIADYGFYEEESFPKVMAQLGELDDFPGRDFIVNYLDYMETYAPREASTRKMYPRAHYFWDEPPGDLPLGLYYLLVGSVAYMIDKRKMVEKYWGNFENDFWPILRNNERDYLAGDKQNFEYSKRAIPFNEEKQVPKKFWQRWWFILWVILTLIKIFNTFI